MRTNMNKNLQSGLNSLTDLDFYQLGRRIEVANWCRAIMHKYELLDKDMAKLLDLKPQSFRHFKFGALDYSLHDLAKLQAIEMKLGQDALEAKVKSRIQFPEYKDTQPFNP